MFEDIIFVVICLIILFMFLDIGLIGFIPRLLGLWSPCNKIGKRLLVDYNVIHVKTDTYFRIIDKLATVGSHIQLLTPDFLVVGKKLLSYVIDIKTKSIYSYSVNERLLFTEITILFTINDEKKTLSFNTQKPDKWIKEFERLGIKRVKKQVGQLKERSRQKNSTKKNDKR